MSSPSSFTVSQSYRREWVGKMAKKSDNIGGKLITVSVVGLSGEYKLELAF